MSQGSWPCGSPVTRLCWQALRSHPIRCAGVWLRWRHVAPTVERRRSAAPSCPFLEHLQKQLGISGRRASDRRQHRRPWRSAGRCPAIPSRTTRWSSSCWKRAACARCAPRAPRCSQRPCPSIFPCLARPPPTRRRQSVQPEPKAINGYTWPGIEYGEPPTCKYTFFEVQAGRRRRLSPPLRSVPATTLRSSAQPLFSTSPL